MTKINFYFKIILELGKVRISIPVALSALVGYTLYNGTIGLNGVLLFWGVFLMSCSSSTINHWQEHKIDAVMPRTLKRPIPSGRISPVSSLLISGIYFSMGSILLVLGFPLLTFGISLTTLIAYNLVYTPLKKITAFAVVPGALVGALPPYIGWIAAGGSISDPIILIIAAFFFIGQIPHFWLLLLMYGNEYKLVGYPSLYDIFSEKQIKRLSFTWILATISAAIIISLNVLIGHTTMFILMIYIFYLLFSTSIQFLAKQNIHVRTTFFKLNILYLFMMLALIIDSLFHRF